MEAESSMNDVWTGDQVRLIVAAANNEAGHEPVVTDDQAVNCVCGSPVSTHAGWEGYEA